MACVAVPDAVALHTIFGAPSGPSFGRTAFRSRRHPRPDPHQNLLQQIAVDLCDAFGFAGVDGGDFGCAQVPAQVPGTPQVPGTQRKFRGHNT